MNQEIKSLIEQADEAIRNEEFDKLMDFYTDDAVLVMMPGKLAHGKQKLKRRLLRLLLILK